MCVRVCVCVCVCVRACVRACVRVCVRACASVRACERACVCMCLEWSLGTRFCPLKRHYYYCFRVTDSPCCKVQVLRKCSFVFLVLQSAGMQVCTKTKRVISARVCERASLLSSCQYIITYNFCLPSEFRSCVRVEVDVLGCPS